MRALVVAVVLAGACADKNKTPDVLAGLETRAAETKFTLDRLNDQSFAAGPAVVLDTTPEREWVLAGWAVDLPPQKPAPGGGLVLDRKRQLPAQDGIPRNDIPGALRRPADAQGRL